MPASIESMRALEIGVVASEVELVHGCFTGVEGALLSGVLLDFGREH